MKLRFSKINLREPFEFVVWDDSENKYLGRIICPSKETQEQLKEIIRFGVKP